MRRIAKVFVPVLLVVALVAALGVSGLGRARAAQSVSAYADTVAAPAVDAAGAVAAELAAATTGGNLAAARTTTDTAVAALVEAARTLDDTRQEAATAAVAARAASLVREVSAARDAVDAGQDAAGATRGYLAAADVAAGLPLELVAAQDVGPALGTALVTLTVETGGLVTGTAATGSVDTAVRTGLVDSATDLSATAADEVTRQLGLAGAAVVALLLAGVSAWLARGPRRGAADGHAAEAGRTAVSAPVPTAAEVEPAAVAQPAAPAAPVGLPAPAPGRPLAPAAATGASAAAALAAAHRDLALLNRQLATLDLLEQTEQDPTVLAELFELDNLTVRLRRNAESLLVLAGGEHGRRAREVAPVTDVLRAAASQIEQYDRVQISLVHDPFLHASHVVPVAHLVAELLENAAAFSEPITPIEVSGACDADSMTIEVLDRGMGLAPADLAAANAQLSAAEDVSDGRIGLRVVARLAGRLGIAVRLRPGPGGAGTVASVRLPRTLFAEPGAPEAAPARPAASTDLAAAPMLTPAQVDSARLSAPAAAGPVFEPTHAAAAQVGDATLPRRLPAAPVVPPAPTVVGGATGPASWQPAVPAPAAELPTFDTVIERAVQAADAAETEAGPPHPRASRRPGSRRSRRSDAETPAASSAAPEGGLTFVPSPRPAEAPGAPSMPGTSGMPGAPGSFLPTQPMAPAPSVAPTEGFLPGVPSASVPPLAAPAAPAAGSPASSSGAPGAAAAPMAWDPMGDASAAQAFRPAGVPVAGAAPAQGFVPAAGPAPTSFAPAEPQSWTGGGVDTAASVRAAAQKVAMAELSGLVTYRPSSGAGDASGSLTSRTPTEVPPPVEDPAGQPLDRDADDLRRRFSAFRAGTSRGRDEAAPTTLLGQ